MPFKWVKEQRKKLAKTRFKKLFFFSLPFVFSYWLMSHTFSYSKGQFIISDKVWSDFAAHIPLIRSFSLGNNFPSPEYPIFAGEPIRYHYLFYALTGFLEKSGLPIDLALNLPSALGLAGLILIIYFLGKELFEKTAVGLLGVLFFLFNGSLAFIFFFKKNGFDFEAFIKAQSFTSFGPYDQGLVSAFWNLNIYTNQRHLALSFFLVLLVVYWLIKKQKDRTVFTLKDYFLIIFILILMPNLHQVGFLSLNIILVGFFLFFPFLRKPLFKIGLLSFLFVFPQILPKLADSQAPATIGLKLGFLSRESTLSQISFYWLLNLGISIIAIPAGFVLANKRQKKILLTFVPLFLIGNLFRFSPEIAANHKFFNLFLIIGNLFSAFFVFLLWQKKLWGKLAALIITFFLIFSGIIDLPPILNDRQITLADLPQNQTALWIERNTSQESVFLNSNYLYHPANLAGRKIYLGWPYFAWSAGYDTKQRDDLLKNILLAKNFNKQALCRVLKNEQIDYVALDLKNKDLDFDLFFWQNNFDLVFESSGQTNLLFEVQSSCNHD